MSSPPPKLAPSPSTSKRTRKATQLISLAARLVGVDRLVVHVDPTTRKADGLRREKLKTYLGVITQDNVNVTYVNWKQVPVAQKI